MTLTLIFAALKRVPAAIYIWSGSAVLIAALFAAAVWRGEHIEKVKIERVARADSTHTAVVRLDTAKANLDTVLARVASTKSATVTTGKQRTAARAAVVIVDSQTVSVAGVLDTVPVAVVALIAADDAKIAADSVHMAATDSLVPAIAVTELAHAVVDTAMVHQIDAGDTIQSGGHGRVVVGALAVLGTLGALFAFLHH